jgi:hypothetical protein
MNAPNSVTRSKPKPLEEQFTVRLRPGLKNQFKAVCIAQGLKAKAVVSMLLSAYIETHKDVTTL